LTRWSAPEYSPCMPIELLKRAFRNRGALIAWNAQSLLPRRIVSIWNRASSRSWRQGLWVGVLLLACGTAGPSFGAPAQMAPFPTTSEALQALSRSTGKIVCWVGTSPSGPASAPETAQTLADAVRDWAFQWDAAVLVTPDAIFFHTVGTFADVRAAHQDELLPVYRILRPLNRLPLRVLGQFPLGLDKVPSEEGADDLGDAVALTEIERAAPGFEDGLRKLLEAAGAQAQPSKRVGQDGRLGAVLDTLPAGQIYLRLAAVIHIYCLIEADKTGAHPTEVEVEIPLSASRLAVDPILLRSAAVLRQPEGDPSTRTVHVFSGSLEALIREGALTVDNRPGPTVVLDRRLKALPLTICVPASMEAQAVWPMLEAGIGVERRDLGEVLFFGPWLDAEKHPPFCFVSRWLGAHRLILRTDLSPLLFKWNMVDSASLSPGQRQLLRSELALQAEHDEQTAKFPVDQFLAKGKTVIYQNPQLDVLHVAPEASTRKPVVLGTYSFPLR